MGTFFYGRNVRIAGAYVVCMTKDVLSSLVSTTWYCQIWFEEHVRTKRTDRWCVCNVPTSSGGSRKNLEWGQNLWVGPLLVQIHRFKHFSVQVPPLTYSWVRPCLRLLLCRIKLCYSLQLLILVSHTMHLYHYICILKYISRYVMLETSISGQRE
jgi:hypothetical protein